MLWAEGEGTPVGITATLIGAFSSLLLLMGWLIREMYTKTLPDHVKEIGRLRRAFSRRQAKLLEHCEREADKERQISQQRYDQSDQRYGAAMKEIRGIEALIRQRARLSDIVESAEDAIWSKSLEGFITSWNLATERLLGWRSGEMVGQSVYRVIPPDLHEQEREMLAALARGERVDRYETERFHRDGRRIRLSVTASAIKDPTGRPIGVSTIAREL
jgi:PAS domain S-box-containing protein